MTEEDSLFKTHGGGPGWSAQLEQWGLGSVGDRALRATVGTEEDPGSRVWPLGGGLRAAWEVIGDTELGYSEWHCQGHAGTGETTVGRGHRCARPSLPSPLSLWVL